MDHGVSSASLAVEGEPSETFHVPDTYMTLYIHVHIVDMHVHVHVNHIQAISLNSPDYRHLPDGCAFS